MCYKINLCSQIILQVPVPRSMIPRTDTTKTGRKMQQKHRILWENTATGNSILAGNSRLFSGVFLPFSAVWVRAICNIHYYELWPLEMLFFILTRNRKMYINFYDWRIFFWIKNRFILIIIICISALVCFSQCNIDQRKDSHSHLCLMIGK